MKTTLDIHDGIRAKRHARRLGRPLRAVVEEGLRQVRVTPAARSPYRLPDLSAGDADAPDPLEQYSWQDLRDTIYGDRRTP